MTPAQFEDALLREATGSLHNPPGMPAVGDMAVRIEGEFPDSALVLTFTIPGRSGTFGYRVPLWDEPELPEELGPVTFFSSVWLDIHESVATGLGVPEEAIFEGVTWIRTAL